MAQRFSVEIPSLLGGVSQQAPQLRLASQAESMVNAYPSVVDGLMRRHPIDHIAALDDVSTDVVFPPEDDLVHFINRDANERYVVRADMGITGTSNGVRVYELDGTPVPVFGPLGTSPDFSYLEVNALDTPPPANQTLKAVTIADYTLVLNRQKVPTLSSTLTGGDPSNGEGFLFVRQGNYETTYTAKITQNATEYTVQVVTWDGDGAPGPGELGSIDTSAIAQAFVVEINALGGTPFTATSVGPVVRIQSSDPLSTIRVEDGRNGLDLIKVHKVIDAIDLLPVTCVDGYRIKIDGGTAGVLDDYYVKFVLDSADATADEWELTIDRVGNDGDIGGSDDWTVTINGNTATYSVATGDSRDDVATGIAAAVDALPDVSATATGAVVTITADTSGPLFVPVVTAPPRFEAFNGAIVIPRGTFILDHTADTVGSFGAGKWAEDRGFDIPVGLDPATMPHKLVRQQDDGAGSITGTPLAKWFEWSPVEWVERAVGDQSVGSAPDPSIVDQPISDMFFYRDRLGFTGGQSVVMSEVNRFFNLYRTTILSLPDSDPIDVTVPATQVVNVHHAAVLDRRLVLFSDDTQFVLDGEPLLTPKTVQVSDTTRYQADRGATPIVDADGIFFAAPRGDFSGVHRYFSTGETDAKFRSVDTTVGVPQYIPGRIIQMATIEPEGLLIVLAEDDRQALYLFKTFRNGDETLQSAWFRYDLGDDAEIQGIGTIGNTLYIVVHRSFAAYLESTVIQSDGVDDGADYLTHLDRRVQFDSGTYSNITGRTTWTLPYNTQVDDELLMVVRSTTGVDGGDVYPLEHGATTLQTTVVSAQGDHSSTPVWIGQAFETRYEFSKLYLKSKAPDGTQTLRTGGRLQIVHGSVVFEKTATLAVEVTPKYRTVRNQSAPFSGQSVSEALLGDLALPKSEFRFSVMSDDAKIEIVASGPLPMAVQAAQFECLWMPRMGVYRG